MTRSPIPLLTTLGVCLAFAACRTPRPVVLRDADYPGTLQAPATLPVEAVWQQRVTASWQAPGQPPQERGFDAAVQRRGDTLTVIGLSPMGSIGFSVEQGPDGIDVVNNIPEQMVIPPRFILLDVQRAFFPWFDDDMQDGERSADRDGERITERWADGRLRERTFTRLDGARDGTIRISYRWTRSGDADPEWADPERADPEWALPPHAVLDNAWFGYRLTIDTSSETRLPTEAPK